MFVELGGFHAHLWTIESGPVMPLRQLVFGRSLQEEMSVEVSQFDDEIRAWLRYSYHLLGIQHRLPDDHAG
ncbi:MAG: hypothetical protein AMS18_03605 [Gemmatimonas sp. SG8_17]|nr:MAG: hypothetical protein AMS18_03605 [Gemmatimonas sp. SG8_17]